MLQRFSEDNCVFRVLKLLSSSRLRYFFLVFLLEEYIKQSVKYRVRFWRFVPVNRRGAQFPRCGEANLIALIAASFPFQCLAQVSAQLLILGFLRRV